VSWGITWPSAEIRRHRIRCPSSECDKEHAQEDCCFDVAAGHALDAVMAALERGRNSPLCSTVATQVIVSDELGGVTTWPAALPNGTLLAAYTLAQHGGLERNANAAFLPRGVDPRNTIFDEELLKEVRCAARAELDCAICLGRLRVPITTFCGHTFCRVCLYSSLRIRTTCPNCSHDLLMQFGPSPHARLRNLNLFMLLLGILLGGVSAEGWFQSMFAEAQSVRELLSEERPVWYVKPELLSLAPPCYVTDIVGQLLAQSVISRHGERNQSSRLGTAYGFPRS
jgi:hypothetical protein